MIQRLKQLSFYCWCTALLSLFSIAVPGHAEELRQSASPPAQSEMIELEEYLGSISVAEWWSKRVDRLISDIELGQVPREKADVVYLNLKPILAHYRTALLNVLDAAESVNDPLKGALEISVPEDKQIQRVLKSVQAQVKSEGYTLELPQTVIDLYNSVNSLYWSRERLLRTVSLELWVKSTGTNETGVEELMGELEQIHLRFELSQLKIRTLIERLPDYLKQVPLLALGKLFNLALMLLLIVWWRRWAKAGLPKLVSTLMNVRPRRKIYLKLARFIWYIDKVRAPVEWMIIAFGIFSILDVRGFGISIFYEFGTIIFKWIFLAWLAVVIIEAIAERFTVQSDPNAATIRIRTIHYLAVYVVLLGLCMNLALNYTGDATLYEWVLMFFGILLLSLGLLLLNTWRPEIQRQMEREVQKPKWVANILATEKGFMSYRFAPLGVLYLIVLKIQRRIISTINELGSGRRFLANFLYRESVRQYGQIEHDDGHPVSMQLRDALLGGQEATYDKYARQELRDLVSLLEQGVGGTVAVVGERGIGKSIFVERALEKSRLPFLYVECSIGQGFDGFWSTFLERLGLTPDQAPIDVINQKLEELDVKVIVIDNVHRLSRPAMGGQAELLKLAKFIAQIGQDVFHIVTIDKAAWHYIRRVRARELLLEQVVVLPPWTEEQIADLIQLRTEAAGIEPDYSRFTLPTLFDEAIYPTLEERRRYGFSRILWSASDGNSEIALRLYVRSLAVLEDGSIIVKMPIPPNIGQLETAGIELLLVLRVIAQSGYASPEEVRDCLGLPLDNVIDSFRVMRWRGWIESVNGYFRITWSWYRPVTRMLVRQNLIER